MLPTLMLLLIFQKESNLISVIASVISSDTYVITFLVKLTEILMCSDFILFGPLYVSFLVFSCFIHSIRVWLLNPNTLSIIHEGHRSYLLCVILVSRRKPVYNSMSFFLKLYTFLSSNDLVICLVLDLHFILLESLPLRIGMD